jgi:hypothetical protein
VNSWCNLVVGGRAVLLLGLCLFSLRTSSEGALLETAGFGYGKISWVSGNTTQGWDVAKGLPL